MTLRKIPRWGWHLLLALLMLLMQQGALRHGVAHHLNGEEGAAAHQICLDCLAFHAGDQAVASDTTMAPLLALQHGPTVAVLPTDRTTAAPAAYLARAPPSLG